MGLGKTSFETDQNVDFQILKQSDGGNQIFRIPLEVPVRGYYSSLSNALYLYFRSNVGYVNVRLVNQSTGEYVTEMVSTDSGVQSIALPFSGSPVIVYVEYSADQTYYAEIY